MNKNSESSDDVILDACLDEVLGGQRPPDLTARILRAWDGPRTGCPDTDPARSPTPQPAATATRKPAAALTVDRGVRRTSARRAASPWLAVAMSLALIGLGSALVWVVWNATEQRGRRTTPLAAPGSPTPPAAIAAVPIPKPPEPAAVPSHSPPEPPTIAPRVTAESSLATTPPVSEQHIEPIAEVNIPDERPPVLADEQIVHAIDELIRNGWQREGLTPAGPLGDEPWCERVYQKVIGRAPNPAEVRSFVDNRSANKRAELVDLLLRGENYVEEFAAHWSRIWSDILIASGNTGTAHRDGLEQYLRRAFGEGKPFDETTADLLTATGSGKIGAADYNGATNFLVAHADRDKIHAQATAHVSRTFLALSLECSQCHLDATWSGIEQQRFWELNAFFRQLELRRDNQRGWLLTDGDVTTLGTRSTDGETYYSVPDGTMRAAYPVFVDGTEIPRDPGVEKLRRRELLAKLLTRSEQFRQAMANRFWAELFGVGFTIPADNMGPHNPPSHPELLAKLGGQFAAHDYDVRALIRWITLSEAFALSSGDVATHDQIGGKLAFDRFPETPQVRVPVLKQLRVASEAYASATRSPGLGATPARVTPTTAPGAVPPELSDVDRLLATVAGEAHRLSRSTVYGNNILDSEMSVQLKIQHMFFATLHRAPTPSEQQAVEELLASGDAGANPTAWEYIWWALASSQEAR